MRKVLNRAALSAGVVFCSASPLFAQVTLPDNGVDESGLVTALIGDLGPIVAVAVGGYMAFLLVRFGIRWARRSAG